MSNHDVGKQCWSVCQQNSKQRYRFAYLSQHEDMMMTIKTVSYISYFLVNAYFNFAQ